MDKIIVVEDNKVYSSVISKRIETALEIEAVCVASMAEAAALVEERNDFFLGLLDLELPDASGGEIVEYFTEMKVPAIVFTGTYDPDLRDRIYDMGAIDYVIKDSPASVDYLVSIVSRVRQNRHIKALVVDDSSTSRKFAVNQLKRYLLNVYEAKNGVEALEVMLEHEDIQLVLTDYHMPRMDGLELIKNMRRMRGKDRLAIIGLSGTGDKNLAPRFIKSGANDFIAKPFHLEEFLCRVSQNLDNMDMLGTLRSAASRDHLTGLYNRRFFFETAEKAMSQAARQNQQTALLMFDIDHFKEINDTHGHEAGDVVLAEVTAKLRKRVRNSDIIARLGGEEFALLLVNPEFSALPDIARDFLALVASTTIEIGGDKIGVTASIGVATMNGQSLEKMMAHADELLYKAKTAGRNRAVIDRGYGIDEVIECPENPAERSSRGTGERWSKVVPIGA